MKLKFFALLALFSMIAGSVAISVAGPKTRSTSKASELLAMLPASEIAMTIDGKRMVDEALPQILSSKPQMLSEMTSKLEQVKDKTGLDLRQFHEIAVGVAMRKTGEKAFAFEPMVLARGGFSPGSVIGVVKTAAGEKVREEKVGGKTVYVVDAEEMFKDSRKVASGSAVSGVLDMVLDGLSRELAITAVDDQIIAIGSLAQMRSMFEAKTKLGPEVTGLATRRPEAIIGLGAAVPEGLSALVPLEGDVFGESLDSIKKLSAAMDVADGSTSVWVAAKTATAETARDLKLMLSDLQDMGKVLLRKSKGDDKRVYQRMVENARIAQTGNEVTLDLKVAQADVDVLVGQLK